MNPVKLTRPEFAFRPLNEAGIGKAETVCSVLDGAVAIIEQQGVAGRELALVITKCQEAMLIAIAGLAKQPENQAA